MMALWTGLKQQHSASDDTIGPNEEESEMQIYKQQITYIISTAWAALQVDLGLFAFEALPLPIQFL